VAEKKAKTKLCECGCRNTFVEDNGNGYKRRFVNGHQSFGKNNPMYGTISPMKGKKYTQEQRKKLSISRLKYYGEGNSNPMKGRRHSKETKRKMSESWYKSEKSFGFKNTKPERFLQSVLSVNGVKYESQKNIYGRPDIFIEPNVYVFVDGCFHHGCKKCSTEKQLNHYIPQRKIKRDMIVNKKLEKQGYKIIRFWEHDINNNLNKCLEVIRNG